MTRRAVSIRVIRNRGISGLVWRPWDPWVLVCRGCARTELLFTISFSIIFLETRQKILQNHKAVVARTVLCAEQGPCEKNRPLPKSHFCSIFKNRLGFQCFGPIGRCVRTVRVRGTTVKVCGENPIASRVAEMVRSSLLFQILLATRSANFRGSNPIWF